MRGLARRQSLQILAPADPVGAIDNAPTHRCKDGHDGNVAHLKCGSDLAATAPQGWKDGGLPPDDGEARLIIAWTLGIWALHPTGGHNAKTARP